MNRKSFRSYEPTFRRHYQTTQSDSGYSYSQFEPAYRYGYDLALDRRYRDRQWDEIKDELQHQWESRYDKPWHPFQSAIQHAWREAKGNLNGDDQEKEEDATFRTLRRRYQESYAARGYPTTSSEDAYRYGYYLAADERYRDCEWAQMESEVRRHWGNQQDISWENFKSTVQDGWNDVKKMLSEYGRDQELA